MPVYAHIPAPHLLILLAALLVVTGTAGYCRDPDEVLSFSVQEGEFSNHFYRRGRVAAHLVMRSARNSRLIVAFPAGNGGVGVWFEETATPVSFRLAGDLEPLETPEGRRGIQARIEAKTRALRVKKAILGSIRVVRNYIHTKEVPREVDTVGHVEGGRVLWTRTTLDGEHHYELSLEPLGEARARETPQGALELSPGHDTDTLEMRITALSDDPPLSPIPTGALLRDSGDADPRALRSLAFLSYDEKLLAGSWRFLTYFGRDTLLSLRLLMPVLTPRVIEAGLGSVLDRLSPEGEVAHEEDVGEFAVLRHRAESATGLSTAPIFDYKMIDDNFMLAPVAAHYLLETPDGMKRAPSFLGRRTARGELYAAALRRNLHRVMDLAAPYGRKPRAENLIALAKGSHVGEWRDSIHGLGGGRIPFDVNASLVPAALAAAARFFEGPLLGPDPEAAARSRRLARVWKNSGRHFHVSLDEGTARRRVAAHARELGLPPEDALASLRGPLDLPALALDGDGRPLPVMHTDVGFRLLFNTPSPEELLETARLVAAPFPAGLWTPAGVVVANGALLASDAQRALFSPGHYHGCVIWSWQQALLAAGLRRQIRRDDLPPAVRSSLRSAEGRLWEAIEAGSEVRTSELWSWAYDRSARKWVIVPFGSGSGHQTESNAAQLWSTVYLALQEPSR